MRQKTFKSDWYTKWLNHQIKILEIQLKDSMMLSLTDKSSNSYDQSQREIGALVHLRIALLEYRSFKRGHTNE